MSNRSSTALSTDLLSDEATPLSLPTSDLPISATFVEAGDFGSGLSQALYLTEAGDSAPISMNDIHQGQIGDCYLLSPIGDLAASHPDLIRNMIHANTDGSETVTLHFAANGQIATPGAAVFKTVTETVTNVFPNFSVNNGSSQDVVGSTKEIWAQVIEKAVAMAGGGYGSISNGGNPAMAMQELTGHSAYAYNPASMSTSMLSMFAKAGDIMTFDTKNSSSLGYNLVGNHAYMFNGVVNTASGSAVSLSNPWGFNQPTLIPVSQLSKNFVEVDLGKVA